MSLLDRVRAVLRTARWQAVIIAVVETGRESEIVEVFVGWLERNGWKVRTSVDAADVVAERGDELLVVQAKGITSEPGLDLDTLYGQLLRRMTSLDRARYAVVVPEILVATACRVPERVRERLQIEVYGVGMDDTDHTQGRGDPLDAACVLAERGGPHPVAGDRVEPPRSQLGHRGVAIEAAADRLRELLELGGAASDRLLSSATANTTGSRLAGDGEGRSPRAIRVRGRSSPRRSTPCRGRGTSRPRPTLRLPEDLPSHGFESLSEPGVTRE